MSPLVTKSSDTTDEVFHLGSSPRDATFTGTLNYCRELETEEKEGEREREREREKERERRTMRS